MTYSQVYWIYTLLIATYFINKNGFRCVRRFFSLRAPFSLFPFRFFSFAFPFLFTQALLAVSFFLFFFFYYLSLSKPRTPYIHLTFGLPVHLLHHYTTVICWSLLGDKLLLCQFLAMNMIKILRNLHLNDALKRHVTFLTLCMKKCFIFPPIGSLINRKEDILLCPGWAQRQRYTVLLIIRAHILPGIREKSDKWIAYNCLQD